MIVYRADEMRLDFSGGRSAEAVILEGMGLAGFEPVGVHSCVGTHIYES